MSCGITTAASTSPDWIFATACARVAGARLRPGRRAAGVFADVDAAAADLDLCAGGGFVDDRDARLGGAARERQADQQRDRDWVDRRAARPSDASGGGSAGPCAAAPRRSPIGGPARGGTRRTRPRSPRRRRSLGRREEARGRAVEQQLAVGEHQRARGVALHLAHIVRGEHDARAICRQTADEAPQPLALARVERGGGLVEREHRRAREQPDRDVHALAVAARQARPCSAARSCRPVCSSIRSTAASGSATCSRRANRPRFSATESLE